MISALRLASEELLVSQRVVDVPVLVAVSFGDSLDDLVSGPLHELLGGFFPVFFHISLPDSAQKSLHEVPGRPLFALVDSHSLPIIVAVRRLIVVVVGVRARIFVSRAKARITEFGLKHLDEVIHLLLHE